jgi:gas vesicle protein
MADGYDRFDNEGGGGGSFVMGLLTGTVLGAGLGMLFAPKSGSELRNQISEQAGNLANSASDGYRKASEAASEGYRRASETAGDWADRGRDMYDKTRDAVARGAEEAQRYVRDTANTVSGSTPAPSTASSGTSSSGSSYGSGSSYSSPSSSESVRGSGTEPTRNPSSSGPSGSRRNS